MAERLDQKSLNFFNEANKQSYATQAKLFLNAFWDQEQARAEEVWDFHLKYIKTDLHLKGVNFPNPSKEGTQLNEHGFHYFLEKNIKPLTVLEARAKLKEADVSFDGEVSFLEFLLWYFKKNPKDFIKRAPQDPKEITFMTPELRAATAALNAAKAEIQKIEDEKDRLEEESKQPGIKGSKAKNELSQLLSRDLTDLNKALLTAEAAVRKLGGTGKETPPGTLWWFGREIEEMKKYKPKSKQ
jgi:hypothetical protein